MAKILVVEDEARISGGFKQTLERKGHTVFIAATGADALSIYPKEMPEVVLLDLGLPDINGRHVLTHIKAHAPQIKVVVVSGYGDQDIIDEVMKLGADHFLVKPVIPPKLHQFLEELLAKK
ncbi:MAG: response regulator [Candidatus Omnitrophota bacterium]